MWFDEGLRISLVRGNIDRRRIEIVQVDRPYDLLGDACRERDGHPIALTVLGIPGALPAEVC